MLQQGMRFYFYEGDPSGECEVVRTSLSAAYWRPVDRTVKVIHAVDGDVTFKAPERVHPMSLNAMVRVVGGGPGNRTL